MMMDLKKIKSQYEKIKYYLILIRLNRPIGIFLLLWPTLWALWLASEGFPNKKILVIKMKEKFTAKQCHQNGDHRKRSQEEIQRRFVDLQFKRSELQKQLKRVNEVLYSLGREIEQNFSYDKFYK